MTNQYEYSRIRRQCGTSCKPQVCCRCMRGCRP